MSDAPKSGTVDLSKLDNFGSYSYILGFIFGSVLAFVITCFTMTSINSFLVLIIALVLGLISAIVAGLMRYTKLRKILGIIK